MIGAEHVDALANATSKLDQPVRDALFGCEDDLLADAGRMSPETFARSCRDLARRLERDQGLERNRRQRRDTYLSRRLNPATGMIEGRFALHPELGNQVFGAIDREVAAIIRSGEQRGDADSWPAGTIATALPPRRSAISSPAATRPCARSKPTSR